MDKIIRILMRRDGLDYDTARQYCLDTRQMIDEAIEHGDTQEAEDIFMDELGLEPDYLIDLLINEVKLV